MTTLPPLAPTVQLLEWQQQAVDECIDGLFVKGHRGHHLVAGTGLGKMYMKALVIRRAYEQGLLKSISKNPIPVLWLYPKAAEIQTFRVIKECGIQSLVLPMSYSALRSGLGAAAFITWTTVPDGKGDIDIIPVWNPDSVPALVVCDEEQMLKNEDSDQSRCVRYMPEQVKYLGASATPFNRVKDARTLIVRVGAVTKYNALPCSDKIAPNVMRDIAHPKAPEDYSPSAVNRLREALEPYTTYVKGIRFKHPARTINSLISFRNAQERAAYERAYTEYLEELLKAGKNTSHGAMARLVAMQKFRQKCEILRVWFLIKRAKEKIDEGFCVIIGSNFRDPLRAGWSVATTEYSLDPKRISFIVGGQSSSERQTHADRFNIGKSDLMLLMMRSGGVAISLHHFDPRSKPRYVIMPPTWSAIDLVQCLGRAHRLTSMSETTQEIVWYRDTIEEYVKQVVENKVRCLNKAVVQKEQWSDVFETAAIEIAKKRAESHIVDGTPRNEDEVFDFDPTKEEQDYDEALTGEGLSNE